jgi:hypothetical protein
MHAPCVSTQLPKKNLYVPLLIIPRSCCETRLPMQELLPVHAPHVQREEAGAATGQGHEHRGHHVRGRPQPSLREAHGGAQPHPQAAPVPLPVLIFHLCDRYHISSGQACKPQENTRVHIIVILYY